MKEFPLALSAVIAPHHHWPMKPAPEPVPVVGPAPVQTRYVDLRELRTAIDQYCLEQKRLTKSARRSRTPIFGEPTVWRPRGADPAQRIRPVRTAMRI